MRVELNGVSRSLFVSKFFVFAILGLALFATSALGQGRGRTEVPIKGEGPVKGETPDMPEWSSTWPGSFSCKAVNASTASDVAHITTDNELKLNYTPSSSPETVTYTSTGGSKPRVLIGTPDSGNTLMTDNNSSLNSLSWSSTKAIAAVLVGGSSSTRLYWMPEGAALGTQFSGSGFQNPNGSTITKVAFCYHEPATVTIIKEVLNSANKSTTLFPFTATNLGPTSFSLVDNNSVGPDRKIVTNLYKFAKWGYTLTVTESITAGWPLADIECTETDTVTDQTQYATTISIANRKATIKLEEGEKVVCTFRNGELGPSAGYASFSGRVLKSDGGPISGARVSVFNPATGVSNVAITSPFGFYEFDDLESGQYYILTVSHKRYEFSDNSRTFSLLDNTTNLDFIANP
ncbi:MAG: carboxypeptidase-like regulatory domain-containing protein [Acidobacteriota bacterium]